MQNYNYAEIAEIKEAISPILSEENLVYTGDTIEVLDRVVETKNGTAKITRVKVAFTIVDPDTNEKIICNYSGDGMDSGDKGIYKAYTGAEKYFLIQTFRIATGDDAENEGGNKVVTNVNRLVTNNILPPKSTILTPAQEKHVENINKVIATTGAVQVVSKPINSTKAGVTIEGFVTALKEKDWQGKPVTEYTVEADGKGKIKVSVWEKAYVSAGDMVQFLNVTSKTSEKYGEQFTAKSVVKVEAEQAAF